MNVFYRIFYDFLLDNSRNLLSLIHMFKYFLWESIFQLEVILLIEKEMYLTHIAAVKIAINGLRFEDY